MTNPTRRRFLGVLGASAVSSMGLSQPATAQGTPVVRMGNNYFDPIGLYVEPGTTVRFEIEAGAHSATAYPERIPTGVDTFDSGTISEGSFEYTFETPGTYDYYCIPHKSVGMVGRIVVGNPGGPAEDGQIPDGDVPESDAIVDQGAIPYETFTGGDGSSDTVRTGSGMGPGMGPGMERGTGPGMITDQRGWGGGGLPLVGGLLGTVGVIGGLLYWLLGRDTSGTGTDDALETLERRYARGEIDEEEFHRRRNRLRRNE
ncbi:plastocyanin/azurin family copper-binding protein [Halopenitus sp. H-Gu1]|uniref:plastocyanin/azurin family copper-binding protein n=1 Tax=Halopenitus sp. H-Gu1 TaxID=3242697 RepID=UPI00359CDF65